MSMVFQKHSKKKKRKRKKYIPDLKNGPHVPDQSGTYDKGAGHFCETFLTYGASQYKIYPACYPLRVAQYSWVAPICGQWDGSSGY